METLAAPQVYCFSVAPPLPKFSRADLIVLAIEAEHCRHVLRRTLEVLRTRKIVPFTIVVRRETRVQLFELEIAVASGRAGAALLQDVRRINMVRQAELKTAPAERCATLQCQA